MENRDISSLEDNFERRFRCWLEEYNRLYEPDVFVTEALRSLADQRKDVAKWVSKTMKSNHLKGKAVDIAYKWSALYPVNPILWMNLCRVMHKYGIVNWYYDLWWWFDKPHFQPVEVQQPVVRSAGYIEALNRKNAITRELSLNSTSWNQTKDKKEKDRLHDRNNLLRSLLS